MFVAVYSEVSILNYFGGEGVEWKVCGFVILLVSFSLEDSNVDIVIYKRDVYTTYNKNV